MVFVTFDAQVTEPCAYHVGINQDWAGAGPAEWLAEELGGKGNIVFMGGIPGNMVDLRRNAAAKAVFADFPDITIIADTPSMWNNATAKQKLTEIVATHGWDKIDGLWTQTGCYVFTQMQVDRGGRGDSLKPCAGNGTNGHRVAQLAPGTTEGAYGLRSGLHGLAALGRAVCLQARDDKVRRHRHSALLRDPDAAGDTGADGTLRHRGQG